MITTEQVKQLRDITGVSIMQCKKALEEAEGDMDKATILLRKKSGDIASKKANRELGAGIITSYIHAGGSVGVLVELSCETDFVAKNEEFKQLAHDIAMHIAAANPEFLNTEDVKEEDKVKVTEVFKKEIEESGKPEEMREKILEGKLNTYFGEKVLMSQSYIKSPDLTISTLIDQAIQKFGEKTEISRFVRFAV